MSFARKSGPPLLVGCALVVATLALYWPVLDCDFVNYDDHPYVVGNSPVRAGLTLEGLRWAFGVGYACNWHPVTWLSHMADCEFFSLNPGGHHLTNLLLHLANTLLLFGVLRRMTRGTDTAEDSAWHAEGFWASALVAGLFAVHPLHVESVAWVAERKDLLCTLFFLLTLEAYGRYAECRRKNAVCRSRESPAGNTHPPSRFTIHVSGFRSAASRYYALALLLFTLGLMSKPMLVTLPFVLLLLDYWPLGCWGLKAGDSGRRTLLPLLLEKLPFFALSTASCVITLVAQQRGGAVVPLQVIPFDARCWNALVSWLRYAAKLVWPQDLSVIYPYVFQWPPWLIGMAVIFLLGGSFLALHWRHSAPYFPVGWFWYLGTLLPVIGLVQVGEQAMADRYTYIPSIGFFILISWAILQLLGRWPRWRAAFALGAVLALAACASATRVQLRYWRDGVALFEHALEVTRNNAVAHATLGLALMDKGKLAEAVEQYEAALRISPEYSLAYNNLGVALARMARFDEAITHYQTALRINPKDAEAHFNLANALNPGFVDTFAVAGAMTNRLTDASRAREHYQAALQLRPRYLNALVNWGNLELTSGNPEGAITNYQKALQMNSLAALAHLNLGNALAKLGRTNDAIHAYTRAVEIEPEDSLARFRLANLLASQSKLKPAIVHYRRGLKQAPGHFVAWCNLGSALATLGEYDEAARCFREATRIQPDYPDAHLNLAQLLAQQGNLQDALKECSEALRAQPDDPDVQRQAALWLSQLGRTREAVLHFSAVAKLRPDNPGAHYDLGLALIRSGQSEEAPAHFREALRLKPDYVLAINNLAWVLAAHEKAAVRNGAEAVSLATRACVLTGFKEPQLTGTLDVAYAETGQYEKAIEMAERTRELALAAGQRKLADAAVARLRLYRAGQPYRERSAGGSRPTPGQ
jgi:protein O-mannosyl-transferase